MMRNTKSNKKKLVGKRGGKYYMKGKKKYVKELMTHIEEKHIDKFYNIFLKM